MLCICILAWVELFCDATRPEEEFILRYNKQKDHTDVIKKKHTDVIDEENKVSSLVHPERTFNGVGSGENRNIRIDRRV